MPKDKKTAPERPAIAHQLDPYKHIEKLPKYGKRTAGFVASVVLQLISLVALVFSVGVTLGDGLLNLVDTSVLTGWLLKNPEINPFFAAALCSVVAVAIAVGAKLCADYSKKSDVDKTAKYSKYASITALALMIVGLIVDVVALISYFV